MCGFAGFLTASASALGSLDAITTQMAKAIAHRGPDDSGAWADAQAGIALGFRRLSIIDLSPAGHQPMASSGGRFVIAFNGEIYNHLEMRAELQAAGVAPAWRGHSDTETLLAGFEHWGVEATFKRTWACLPLRCGMCRRARCTLRATVLVKNLCITAGRAGRGVRLCLVLN